MHLALPTATKLSLQGKHLFCGVKHFHASDANQGVIWLKVGYVMQPGAAAAGGSAYGAERGYGRGRSSGGYGSGNQRYRPY